MTLAPRLRTLARTAHVVASVGWLGAVVAFLALAVAALASQDIQTVRAAHVAMELITRFVLVPLAFASLVTGLVGSLGTRWGLFRHYWVLFKLVLNILATVVLLVYTRTMSEIARAATDVTVTIADLHELGRSPALHAGAALALLLLATVLAVHKPRGMTRYGLRKRHERGAAPMP